MIRCLPFITNPCIADKDSTLAPSWMMLKTKNQAKVFDAPVNTNSVLKKIVEDANWRKHRRIGLSRRKRLTKRITRGRGYGTKLEC
jgi:hypothetical protein